MGRNEGFVRVRRGLRDHLSTMTGLELKCYLWFHFEADFAGNAKGCVRFFVTEMAEDLESSRANVSLAVKRLCKMQYLVDYKPASNSYAPAFVRINKYEKSQVSGSAGIPNTTSEDTTNDTRGTTRDDTGSPPATSAKAPPKNVKNVKKKDMGYSAEFEEFWTEYPRRAEKRGAYAKWCARLADGFTPADLTKAAKKYASLCESEGREDRVIKLPATFLGPAMPFEDFLKAPEKKKRRDISAGLTPCPECGGTGCPACGGAGYFKED
jgi:hypothetical protein